MNQRLVGVLLASLACSVMIFATGCRREASSPRVFSSRTGGLRLNHQFTPIVADSVLNDRYHYRLLCSIGKTRVYLLQEKDERSPDLVCVCDEDLTSNQAIKDNTDIYYDGTGLQFFSFYPRGQAREFGRYECTAQQVGITIAREHGRLVLVLDQLFVDGGSGGHQQLIARRYMIVGDGRARVTRDYSIVTDFRIGYPRHYGLAEWKDGSMSYSHSFDHNVSMQNGKLTVTCKKQHFELEHLFASADAVKPKPAATEVWGERFKYNDFILPRDAQVRETREKEMLQLMDLFVR